MALRWLVSNIMRKTLGARMVQNWRNPYMASKIYANYSMTTTDKPSEEVSSDKENFHLRFNVENFSPEDLQIKVIGNILVIEGMHGEKEDEGGVIRRYFVRKYTIPECFDTEKVLSSLSTKGILEIQAPIKKCLDEPVVERNIPIQKSS